MAESDDLHNNDLHDKHDGEAEEVTNKAKNKALSRLPHQSVNEATRKCSDND